MQAHSYATSLAFMCPACPSLHLQLVRIRLVLKLARNCVAPRCPWLHLEARVIMPEGVKLSVSVSFCGLLYTLRMPKEIY